LVQIGDGDMAIEKIYNIQTGEVTEVTYTAPTVSAEELLEELRQVRNIKLAETDYLALSDNTLSTEMSTYRQALRDITDNATSLSNVTWPTKP